METYTVWYYNKRTREYDKEGFTFDDYLEAEHWAEIKAPNGIDWKIKTNN